MVVSWGGKTTCETVLTRSVNATRPPSSCCATMQEISVIFIYFIFVVYRKPCPNKRWWRKKKKQKACLYIHFYILDIIQFLPAAPEAWFGLLLVLNVLIVWIQNVLLYYPLVVMVCLQTSNRRADTTAASYSCMYICPFQIWLLHLLLG